MESAAVVPFFRFLELCGMVLVMLLVVVPVVLLLRAMLSFGIRFCFGLGLRFEV